MKTIFGIQVVPDPTLAPYEWKLVPLTERQKMALDLGRRYDEAMKMALDLGRRYDEAMKMALGFLKDKKDE